MQSTCLESHGVRTIESWKLHNRMKIVRINGKKNIYIENPFYLKYVIKKMEYSTIDLLQINVAAHDHECNNLCSLLQALFSSKE